MLPRSVSIALVLAVLATLGRAAEAGQAGPTTTLTLSAQFHTRTSLRVSSSLLQFEVADAGVPAVAAVEFVAAARTRRDGEVILTVQPERWLEGPGGAADVEASVTFGGDEPGLVVGELLPATPAIAGRWVGSGRRTGRLVFALRAAAGGTYTLPVRLVLTTP